MAHNYYPRIGDWYQEVQGQTFEVVALDEEEGAIEIQYFDGSVEEVDLDTWYDLDIEPQEQSEDWSGPFDDLEADDFGETERSGAGENWNDRLDEV